MLDDNEVPINIENIIVSNYSSPEIKEHLNSGEFLIKMEPEKNDIFSLGVILFRLVTGCSEEAIENFNLE